MNIRLFSLITAMIFLSSSYALAQEGMNHDEPMEPIKNILQETKTMSQAIEVGNKICPVSNEKIPAPGEKNSMGEAVQYEYNGKIYNLCCPMCIKDFKKSPEKYSKIAENEVAKKKR